MGCLIFFINFLRHVIWVANCSRVGNMAEDALAW